MSLNTTLSNTQITDLARPFVFMVDNFFKDPENEKGFQKWLQEQKRKEVKEGKQK